jgi:hypothetical protein
MLGFTMDGRWPSAANAFAQPFAPTLGPAPLDLACPEPVEGLGANGTGARSREAQVA